MKHWNELEWTDFVKGVTSPRQRREMRAHLRRGCPCCRSRVARLETVVADVAAQTPPPADAVAGALAIFAVANRQLQSRRRWVPLAVIFDSWAQPPLPGTRSLSASHRHLVFSSRDFTLDARMAYGDNQEELSVVGQLITRSGRPLPKVPTFLKAGGQILSQARTTAMGEFQMACREARRLRLCLALADRRLIEVDLDGRRRETAAEPTGKADFGQP